MTTYRTAAFAAVSTVALLALAACGQNDAKKEPAPVETCLLYTSPSPRDLSTSRMPSSA